MLWRKFNGDPIQIPILQAVEDTIKRESDAGFHLKVCIGTDSQVKSKETEFATVIVFVRKGKGAFMYIYNETTKRKMPTWLPTAWLRASRPWSGSITLTIMRTRLGGVKNSPPSCAPLCAN